MVKKKLLLVLSAAFSIALFANAENTTPHNDRHLTGKEPLKSGEIINLTSPTDWVFFDDVKPQDILTYFYNNIRIDGYEMQPDENCRLLIYKHGGVVVPQPATFEAFTLFSEKDLKGESESMIAGMYYTNDAPDKAPINKVRGLELDNKGSSFILRRGYMATLATESDGMGYSRVFVADTSDLIVDELPELLNNKVSYIRVLPWQYTDKKGWAGSKWTAMPEGLIYAHEQAEYTNCTWYYNWGTSPTTNPNKSSKNYNQEFVPEIWGATSSTSKPYSLEDACHLMGFNEPDHSEQSNVSVEKAIEIWPELIKTGMRLGSPATTDFSWLYKFMEQCKQKNYRVDYVVVHAYWGGLTGREWYNKLKDVYDHVKRPIWIKEWNNGANWTKETWPSGTAEQQAKQLRDLKEILTVMDTCTFIERYSIYNWVEDKRAIILGSTAKLTPAGEYYASDQPDYFYRHDMQFVPTYTVRTAPLLRQEGIDQEILALAWNDENKEFVSQYKIQQSTNGKDFETIATCGNEENHYEIEIRKTNNSALYYRIISSPITGSEQVSNVLTVNMVETENGLSLSEFLIDENWTAALFTQGYDDKPIIVLGTPTYRNKMPLSWTSSNVSTTAFDYRLATWDYQEGPTFAYPDTIAVMTSTNGSKDFIGLKSEKGIIEGVTTEWKHIVFPDEFEDIPVVIPTLMTNNCSSASSPRVKNVTSKGFDIHLQFEGRNRPDSIGENVSYLAIQQGTGEISGRKVIVGLSPENAVNDNLLGGTHLDYGMEFDELPLYFAAMQTEADTITSVLRIKSRNLTSATLIKDREKSVAHERVTPEQVGWVAIERTPNTPEYETGIKPHTAEYENSQDMEYYSLSGTKITSGTLPKIAIGRINGKSQKIIPQKIK